MKYAKRTAVGSTKSRAEIERVLIKYGADQFIYGMKEGTAVIGFRMNDRAVRFHLPLPYRSDFAGTRKRRRPEAIEKAWEQAGRQRWRALLIAIKAKLEAVECGITEFEQEFLAHIVLPSGKTVGEWAVPQIQKGYDVKKIPLLPEI